MTPQVEHLVQATIALVAITNPVGAAPVFLSLVGTCDRDRQRRAALHVALAVFVILAAAAIGGRWVLRAFGVSFPAFQTGGGLIIILMGIEMMRGKPTKMQHAHVSEADSEEQILVPLAMPLIAGPGAITTVITLSVRDHHWHVPVSVLISIVVASAALWATLRLSIVLERWISERGHLIVLRFMGLILVSVGAQELLVGIRTFFAGT